MTYRIISQRTKRRRGFTMVYVAAGIVAFMGICSLVVDLGLAVQRRSHVQKACDATALRGATVLASSPFGTTAQQTTALAAANTAAVAYATSNYGYTTDANTTVTVAYNPTAKEYSVSIARRQPVLFASIFQMNRSNYRFTNISASGTALVFSQQPGQLNPTAGGTYGSASNIVNLSMFGPNARYEYGDGRSTQTKTFNTNLANTPGDDRIASEAPINEEYSEEGYSFPINIPAGYATAFNTNIVQVEIFDPDGSNPDGNANAANGRRVDELRRPDGGNGTASDATKTRYTLVWNPNTVTDPNFSSTNDVVLGTKDYKDETTGVDMQWTQDSAFRFDITQRTGGSYRLKAKTIEGSSENGFLLRAGPSRPVGLTNAQWDAQWNNATATQFSSNPAIPKITALGDFPMNFNTSGTVTLTLGDVPSDVAGRDLYISKFDTDVGASSLVYTATPVGGGASTTYNGNMSANGQWRQDTISLPANYTTSTWTATYVAGLGDTSVWRLSYSGMTKVRLVK